MQPMKELNTSIIIDLQNTGDCWKTKEFYSYIVLYLIYFVTFKHIRILDVVFESQYGYQCFKNVINCLLRADGDYRDSDQLTDEAFFTSIAEVENVINAKILVRITKRDAVADHVTFNVAGQRSFTYVDNTIELSHDVFQRGEDYFGFNNHRLTAREDWVTRPFRQMLGIVKSREGIRAAFTSIAESIATLSPRSFSFKNDETGASLPDAIERGVVWDSFDFDSCSEAFMDCVIGSIYGLTAPAFEADILTESVKKELLKTQEFVRTVIQTFGFPKRLVIDPILKNGVLSQYRFDLIYGDGNFSVCVPNQS